jgi:TPR repeat protein
VASAFVALGAYSLNGKAGKGAERDTARAFEMFSYAATEFGDMHAQYNLGLMYLEGAGITKDVRRGARWLRLAADKQHVESQAVLGRLYFNGIDGVQRQRALGLMYLTMAREGASEQAKYKWIVDLYDGAITVSSDTDRQAALTYFEQFVKGRR